MVGWHHRLNGFGFEQALEVGDGQGGLVSMGAHRVRQDWATELNGLTKLLCEVSYSTEYRNFLVSFCLRLSLRPLLITSCSYCFLFKCIWISAVKQSCVSLLHVVPVSPLLLVSFPVSGPATFTPCGVGYRAAASLRAGPVPSSLLDCSVCCGSVESPPASISAVLCWSLKQVFWSLCWFPFMPQSLFLKLRF